MAETAEEAAGHAGSSGGETFVVKAQIHAGGRGKGGGIKLVKTLQELHAEADRMLGKPLVTPQTGPKGRRRAPRLCGQGHDHRARALPLAAGRSRIGARRLRRLDRRRRRHRGGGREHAGEDRHPHRRSGLGHQRFSWPGNRLGTELEGALAKQCAALVKALYRLFVEKDASLIEINPLVVTKDGNLLCLDAKIGFDDNAIFRHKDIAALRDIHEEDPAEVEAANLGSPMSSSTARSGAWSTARGSPCRPWTSSSSMAASPRIFSMSAAAPTKERVAEAFKIILSDPHVKAVLVNIFGGIMRCDTIAEGIIAAARDMHIAVPLMVRLEGTNVERGKELLRNPALPSPRRRSRRCGQEGGRSGQGRG